jgi:pyruvate/2-oxoglutarate/acetoin dehydrogenase E1 component
MSYSSEMRRAMNLLAADTRTVFLGQSVVHAGTSITPTLADVPLNKRIEMPVCEDMQAGIANGLALAGKIPVSIFPRWNFFLLAVNQVVNHLDKIAEYSDYRPQAILRVSIGSLWPWNSQAQHIGDYTDTFRSMLKNVEVIRLDASDQIVPAYELALHRKDGRSTMLVEWSDHYYEQSPYREGADMTDVARKHAAAC